MSDSSQWYHSTTSWDMCLWEGPQDTTRNTTQIKQNNHKKEEEITNKQTKYLIDCGSRLSNGSCLIFAFCHLLKIDTEIDTNRVYFCFLLGTYLAHGIFSVTSENTSKFRAFKFLFVCLVFFCSNHWNGSCSGMLKFVNVFNTKYLSPFIISIIYISCYHVAFLVCFCGNFFCLLKDWIYKMGGLKWKYL